MDVHGPFVVVVALVFVVTSLCLFHKIYSINPPQTHKTWPREKDPDTEEPATAQLSKYKKFQCRLL